MNKPAFVVRKLLWIALGALCGVFAVLFGLRSYLLTALLAAAAVGLFLLKKRVSTVSALLLLGAAAGMFWCVLYAGLFLSGADDLAGKSASYTATVAEAPSKTRYGTMTPILLHTEKGEVSAALYLPEYDFSATPGDILTGEGRFTLVAEDYTRSSDLYLRANGFYLTVRSSSAPTVTPSGSVPLKLIPAVWAAALRENLRRVIPEDARGLFLALVTGDRTEIDGELRDGMANCGVLHAISLSGMHVALLTGIVIVLCGRRRRLAALIGIPVITAFVLLSGASAATVRAAVMQYFLLLAPLVRREYDPLTGLSAALLVLLAINPWCAANWGMQLSFVSTAGIILFVRKLYEAFTPQRWRHGVLSAPLRYVTATLAVTLSANLLSMPLSAAYFGVLSVIAPLANILILWAISLCFAGGLLAALLAFVWMPGAAALGTVLALPYRWIALVVRLLSSLPFAAIYKDSPYLMIWLYGTYLIAFVTAMTRTRAWPSLLSAAAILALALGMTAIEFAQEGVTALDVGQGSCVIARRNGDTVVIDCGGDGDAGETAARFLLARGEKELDALVLTHFDADHVNGVAQLLSRVDVKTVFVPEGTPISDQKTETLELLRETNANVVYVDDVISLPRCGGSFTLYPPLSEGEGDNERGICVLCSCGGIDLLVTGDLPIVQEHALVTSYAIPDLEILIAGHHGSGSSTGEELLDRLRPEVVVISVGDNAYGHPAPETIERITRFGATAYRTDQNGNLTVRW
ncbi:MAG: DNA internalization-related competence protein ComEC/Rec2 [Oscillospiraceae bacterium]|nr:DNA internalization-related competence protein ComEC/Rec2 [Oscillospiraceae bacterium]